MKFYTDLAKYYDQIYHYVDYEKRVNFFIEKIAEFNQSGNNKILEVACGTGIIANLLQKKGFKVIGVDISEEMLIEARKKNSQIKFIRQDMKQLDLNKKFSVIIIFFNSILYNKNKEEMEKTLANFYKHLEKGGLLIFDAVDKSIGIDSKKEDYKNEDLEFRPQWILENDQLKIDIDFIIDDKEYHDLHVMGAFSIAETKQIIEDVGFEVVLIEKDFAEKEPYKSKWAIFVCRK